MTIRHYTPNDYDMIHNWMKKRNQELLPADGLASTGFIINECVAGFLYTTDSSISFIDTFVSDPDTSKEERSEALDLLVKSLIAKARDMKAKYVMVTVLHKTLDSHFINNGMTLISSNSRCLMGVL